MGATNARHEDAALGLAVPKHYTIAHRRLLNPKNGRCEVCLTKFTPFLDKKHYCRRCGSIICDNCSHLRAYRARELPRFKICRKCDMAPSLIQQLPQKLWHLVISFAGNRAHNNSLQTCKKLQLAVPLPYPWGPGWDAFFTEGTFLSKGANGSVFKASMKSDPLRRPVAVKVIQKSSVYSLRKWHHIGREVDCLKACKHKHVIDLIFVAQCPDAVFMVLEYAQGGDLFDWLVTRKVHTEADVKPLAFQLMSVLAFMHDEVNAVHRDIKPENILLEKRARSNNDNSAGGEPPQPVIKLADFGFARRIQPQKQQQAAMLSARGRTLSARGEFGGAIPVPAAGGGNNSSSRAMAVPGAAGPQVPFGSMPQPTPLLMPGQKPGEAVFVQATPCGTLGFAPPEVLKAFHDAKDKSKPSSPNTTSPPGDGKDGSRSGRNSRKASPSPEDFPDPTAEKTTGTTKSGTGSKNSRSSSRGRRGGASSEEAEISSSSPDNSSNDVVHRTANAPTVPLQSMKKTDIFAAGVTLSILLTGCEPFPSSSSKALVDAVNRGLRFGRHWSHVSRDARIIISQMLLPREKDRPTAREILESAWLRSFLPSIASSPSSLTNSITSATTNGVREALTNSSLISGPSVGMVGGGGGNHSDGVSPVSGAGAPLARGNKHSTSNNSITGASVTPPAQSLEVVRPMMSINAATPTSVKSKNSDTHSQLEVDGSPVQQNGQEAASGGIFEAFLKSNPPAASAAIPTAAGYEEGNHLNDLEAGGGGGRGGENPEENADPELFVQSLKSLKKGGGVVYATDRVTGSITLANRLLGTATTSKAPGGLNNSTGSSKPTNTGSALPTYDVDENTNANNGKSGSFAATHSPTTEDDCGCNVPVAGEELLLDNEEDADLSDYTFFDAMADGLEGSSSHQLLSPHAQGGAALGGITTSATTSSSNFGYSNRTIPSSKTSFTATHVSQATRQSLRSNRRGSQSREETLADSSTVLNRGQNSGSANARGVNNANATTGPTILSMPAATVPNTVAPPVVSVPAVPQKNYLSTSERENILNSTASSKMSDDDGVFLEQE